MRYLYGDSTESSIDIDYLSFLRGGIDFAAAVFEIGAEIARLSARRDELAAAGERDVAAFRAIAESVSESLRGRSEAEDASQLAACASAVFRESERVVSSFVHTRETQLRGELARVDEEIEAQHKSAAAALETFVLNHPLPDVERSLEIAHGAGERYEARARESAELDLSWTTELAIPAGHLFASPLRVDRALERLGLPKLAIGAPKRGRLRRRPKWLPRRLGKEYVGALERSGDSTKIQLRQDFGPGRPQLEIVATGRERRVVLKPLGRRDEWSETFEVEPEDGRNFVAFVQGLERAADELRAGRRAIAELRYGDEPYASAARPTELARRLLAQMAPVASEIARRSPGEEELVLKRLVAGDRREEVFVSFDELRGKIAHLPEGLRREFRDLPFYAPSGSPPAPAPARAIEEDEVTVDRAGSL